MPEKIPQPKADKELKSIRIELELLVDKMQEALTNQQKLIKLIHPDQKISARNLIRYLALRSEDVRSFREPLIHMACLFGQRSRLAFLSRAGNPGKAA